MMTLHGIDLYLWSPTTPKLPDQIGKLSLTMISNRGTRIYPLPAPKIDLLDWPCCRYLSDQEVTDAEIEELIATVTAEGYRWTKCQKLFKRDGANLFSEPY